MTAKNKNMMFECLKLCVDCAEICEDTLANVCIPQGGKHMEEDHVKLMMDCIQICQTAAGFMRRESALHAYICEACAEICEACADSCAGLEGREMEECADICRRCADACRAMNSQRRAA